MTSIKTKLAKTLALMYKQNTMPHYKFWNKFINSLFYPYLNYAIPLWGNASSSTIKPLEILQKRAIHIILNKPWNAHTQPLFLELNLLTLKGIHALHSSLFMHNIYHNNISDTFINMFIPISSVHKYTTVMVQGVGHRI